MLFKRFVRDRGGSVLPLFAIAIVPVIGFVAAAVDYSRAGSMRSEIQAAIDATTLMLSKEATGLTQTQLNEKATAYFNGIINRPDVTTFNVLPPKFTSEGGSHKLKIEVSGSIDTGLARLLGQTKMDIGSSSEVVWGTKTLELALALDNTGSMASANKMTELKKAAKGLLDTLHKAAGKTDDVRVAIIPFATDVNIGTGNVNAAWLDWTSWEAPPANAVPGPNVGPGSDCPYKDDSTHEFHCMTEPTNGSPSTSTIPSSGSYKGYICPSEDTNLDRHYNGCYNSVPTVTTTSKVVDSGKGASCDGAPNCSCTGSGKNTVCTQIITTTGAPYTHNWIANAHSTWNGCVWDREKDNNYDANDTAPDTSKTTQFQPHQASNCPISSLPLVDILANWVTADLTSNSPTSTLGKKINAMTPTGNTNVTIGLAWGWHALTQNDPFTQASVPQGDLDKVVILLTDGDNTRNRFSTTQSDIDARTKKACDNLRTTSIKVYTVRVINGNATLLKGCATKTDMYYDVQDASALNAVFTKIAKDLANLRIAK